MKQTNSLTETLNKLNSIVGTDPLRYSRVNENKEAVNDMVDETAAEAPDAGLPDLYAMDWHDFTVENANVVDLLKASINTLIQKYNKEKNGTDGLTFTFNDVFEIAGIADVDATDDLINYDERTLADLLDEDGFNWRYHCMRTALEDFENDADWDVEVDDHGVTTEWIKKLLYGGYKDMFESLVGDPWLKKIASHISFVNLFDGFDDKEKKKILALSGEKIIADYTVFMTEAEEDEFEDDVNNANEDETGGSLLVARPLPKILKEIDAPVSEQDVLASNKVKTSSRVAEPQIITTLNALMKALNLG